MRTGKSRESIPLFCILSIVFLVMMTLSFLTPMIADDYSYCFSFEDYHRIRSVGDIAPSMIAHRETTNGRIVTHSLVQLSLLMPKAVFNIVNGLAAALFVYLVSCFADMGHEKKNLLVICCAVFAFWYFVPQFGEVFLWLDGAFNYGWAMLISLCFVLPFYYEFRVGGLRLATWVRVCFLIFSFLAGAYSESASLAMLFIAACLSVGILLQKRKIPSILLRGGVFALFGYIFLILSPSALSGRTGEFSASAVARSMEYIIQQTQSYLGVLYCVFMLILCVSVETILSEPKEQRDFRPVIFAVIAFVGGLGSIAIFAFAKYFPNRAMCASACWTIIGCIVLLAEIFSRRRALVSGLAGVLIALFAFSFALGVLDIAVVHKKSNERLAMIEAAKTAGEKNIVLEKFVADTKYSPAYELVDVADGKNEWPNDALAWYFGFETVSGK